MALDTCHVPRAASDRPDVSIKWADWERAAFERARGERKPVLLSIVAAWCAGCAEMDRTSYGEPRVVSLVEERFVPIRVDADRRPDIADRYGLGGWPTTAFLTPDGALLGGGTYVEASRLPSVLDRAADAYGRRHASLGDALVVDAPAIEAHAPASAQDLTDAIFATFDAECGGFGAEPKFPHAAAIHLALAECDHGACARDRDRGHDARRDGVGGLYDDIDGGFFRCATRDWREPSRKLPTPSLLDLYVSAWQALGLARYRERAKTSSGSRSRGLPIR